MITAKPEEILALAEVLTTERTNLRRLTEELTSLRGSLLRLWPDSKGEEVRAEMLRIEELNETADEVLSSQTNALLEAFEVIAAAQNIELGGGRL